MASELLYRNAPANVNKSLEVAIETISETLAEFKKVGDLKPTRIEQELKDASSKAVEATFTVDEFRGKLYSICLEMKSAKKVYLHVGTGFVELSLEDKGRTMEILLQKDRTVRHEQFS